MGSLHSLEDRALAQLRARLGAAEEDRQDLIAFARGHRGAVAAIHRAVLLAMQSDNIEALRRTVIHDWPPVLGIDHCALALPGESLATLATRAGVAPIDPAILRRALAGLAPVTLRDVDRGHALFGRDCPAVRAEALIEIELAGPTAGLLLLGQGRAPCLNDYGGSELLRFLGRSLGAMIDRWRKEPTA